MLRRVKERLPVSMRRGWLVWVRNSNRKTNFENFAEWIEDEMDLIYKMGSAVKHTLNEKKKRAKGLQVRCTSCVCSEYGENKNFICCRKKGHGLTDCRFFSRKPAEERWSLVKMSKVCFCCLEFGHSARAEGLQLRYTSWYGLNTEKKENCICCRKKGHDLTDCRSQLKNDGL